MVKALELTEHQEAIWYCIKSSGWLSNPKIDSIGEQKGKTQSSKLLMSTSLRQDMSIDDFEGRIRRLFNANYEVNVEATGLTDFYSARINYQKDLSYVRLRVYLK